MDQQLAGPTEPSAAALVENLPADIIQSEMILKIGLPVVSVEDVKEALVEIFEDNAVAYPEDSDLAKTVSDRIVEEIELFAKLANPSSVSQPEWYDPDNTLIYNLTNRDELTTDFAEELQDNYELPAAVTDDIIEWITDRISDTEPKVTAYYVGTQ